MARTRSPSYPGVPLSEAMDFARRIYEKDHRHMIPREVAAHHLGFKSLHGSALTALAALRQYGLVEVAQGSVAISDLAMEILAEPESSDARRTALHQAANSPKLFAELGEQFHDHPPSDESLRSYLMKRNFNSAAIGDVIRSYRETMELVSEAQEELGSTTDLEGPQVEGIVERTPPLPSASRDTSQPTSALVLRQVPKEDELKVLHDGERLQISASVGREGIARLKKMLDMYEAFLAPSPDPEQDKTDVGGT